MRIRTQLILAAFVLAVVPLAAIVTYSYHSSRVALESVYRRETDRLTEQMDKRLESIRADLERRLTFASALPLPENTSEQFGDMVTVMGESASLIDALEFQPARERPERAEKPEIAEKPEVEETPETPAVAAVASVAPPPPPAAPVMIDLPPVAYPKFVMSEEHKELIDEVSRIGAQLGNLQLSDEEREDLRAEMRDAQEELRKVLDEDRAKFATQMEAARHAQRERNRLLAERRQPGLAPVAVPSPAPAPSASPQIVVRQVTPHEREKSAASAKRTSLILGKRFAAPVRQEGQVVGQLTARISPDVVIRRVLGGATEDRSEIPFAIDREGTLYTRSDEEKENLAHLGIFERVRKNQPVKDIRGWIVSTSTDPESGLRIGVARPVADNFDELRRTAGRNFALGLGLIVFAMIGIVPLSNHLTRDVKLVTEGADRIAHGDLMTRLPAKSKNELGQLARAFNRMAEDLSVQQQKLVEGERSRKEQEIQQRLLAVEYERKSVELEDARRFQLSMLPKEVPQHAAYDVAVFTRTATEVGGDYYDFHLEGDVLSVTIGDATGHGAKAGTMVTVIKTLFAGYDPKTAPSAFLGDAAEKIKRMDLGRMAMALSLARFERDQLTVASAGMPPVLVHRAAEKTVEEIALGATPLGTLGIDYPQTDVSLRSGDTVLFLSDGFPELMNDAGQQLGYSAALDVFTSAASCATASDVIAALAAEARGWHGDAAPNDDVTFVVVRLL